jgi:hypothetical protein
VHESREKKFSQTNKQVAEGGKNTSKYPCRKYPSSADVPAPAIAKRQRVSPPCNQLQQLAQAQKIGQLEQILEQKDADLLQLCMDNHMGPPPNFRGASPPQRALRLVVSTHILNCNEKMFKKITRCLY